MFVTITNSNLKILYYPVFLDYSRNTGGIIALTRSA